MEVVVIWRWLGWFVSGWWRGQDIWDLISYRAGAIWCPLLTARPSVQVGNGGLRTYEGLLSFCTCALLVGVDDEPSPRPSRSLGTSSPMMVSKRPGGHGRSFIGSSRFPGFFSPFARLSGNGIRTTDSRSHLGVWRIPSRLGRQILGPDPTQCLLVCQNIWRRSWTVIQQSS